MATNAQFIQFGNYFSAGVQVTTLNVYHYTAGTTTLKDVYTGRDKTTAAAQPVVSDSNGIVSFYADGLYKFKVTSWTAGGAGESTLYTYDNVAVIDGAIISQGKGADLTSASTLTLGTDGNYFDVTGSTTITGLSGSITLVTLQFDSTPQLTHSATLNLKGAVNFTAVAGDVLTFVQDGSTTTWREVSRSRHVITAVGPLLASGAGNQTLTALDTGNLIYNTTLTATVAANALTVALKTKAGTDPSATDPVRVAFRNATVATGTYTVVSIEAALSVVLPSGGTLGFAASQVSRIYILAMNNAGTVVLGLYHPLTGTGLTTAAYNLVGINESIVYSSTAIGAGSDSGQVIYTTAGMTNIAVRVLGYIDIATGATPGEWSAAPSVVQIMGPGVPCTGDIVQRVSNWSGSVATGTTAIPFDTSTPQDNEGDQYMSQAVTLQMISSLLKVYGHGSWAHSVNSTITVTVSNLASGATNVDSSSRGQGAGNNLDTTIPFGFIYQPQSLSAVTYRIRAGTAAGATTTFNGVGGAIRDNVLFSHMMCEEIAL
mgnify:CR=1 FL=1